MYACVRFCLFVSAGQNRASSVAVQIPFTLFFETGSLTHRPRLTGQGAAKIRYLLRFQVCATMSSWYVDSEGAKSGHAVY